MLSARPAAARTPPGPRIIVPFAAVRRLRRAPLAYCEELARDYGDLVYIRWANMRTYMVWHPDHLRHVLQENNANYVKGPMVQRTKSLIGEGLFSSEGELWRRQRRLMQPVFYKNALHDLGRTMAETIDAYLAGMQRNVAGERRLDLSEEMTALTLSVVGQALFGLDLTGDAATVGRAFMTSLEFVNRRVTSVAPIPVFVPTPASRRYRAALAELDRVVYRIMDARRAEGCTRNDLLSRLLAARDEETGEGMSDHQMRDEVMTFVLAGHETTANALTWAWYLLCRHPHVERRLRDEVDGVLGRQLPGPDDLDRLPYARMVIEETMRLYPPLWGFPRQAVGDDVLGGYSIGRGAMLSLFPYLTHRDPRFWPDPMTFDPERFLPERCAERPRYAYLPFSGGPRLCIGREFALIEAQLALAMMVQRFRMRLADSRPVRAQARITLRPLGGLPVIVTSGAA